METAKLDKMIMKLVVTGVFHGLAHQSRKVFEYYIKYGSVQAQRSAHVGVALLAMVNGQAEIAKKIIDMLDCQSAEELGIKALIYKTAKIGHVDDIIDQLKEMGGDAAEFAEMVSKQK